MIKMALQENHVHLLEILFGFFLIVCFGAYLLNKLKYNCDYVINEFKINYQKSLE